MTNYGLNEGKCNNHIRWGLDEDMIAKKACADYLHERYSLYTMCVPVGLSAGGLHVIKLAARHPEIVSSLYLDALMLKLLSIITFILNRRGSSFGLKDPGKSVRYTASRFWANWLYFHLKKASSKKRIGYEIMMAGLNDRAACAI